MKNRINSIYQISRVTFLEIVRDKVFYNGFLVTLFLLAAAFLASKLTYVRPERIVLDFGLTVVSICSVAMAILLGATLLPKEIERRTIYVLFSKPLRRWEYVLGRYFGLVAILILNLLILSSIYLGIYVAVGGKIHGTLLIALGLITFQMLLPSAFAILFSIFSTVSLSITFSVGLYLIGNSITELRFAASKAGTAVGSVFLESLAYVFPNFEFFNLDIKATYGLPVSPTFLTTSFLYGIIYTIVFVLLSIWALNKKEV